MIKCLQKVRGYTVDIFGNCLQCEASCPLFLDVYEGLAF